uniref:lysozyme n=1 Tax=Ruditapes philippinarum TaxID=129788 RepID=R9WXF4_RUDPH|nr:c-type lysozyme 2 [Ruditapes philippinarum]
MNMFQIIALVLIVMINGSLGGRKSKCEVVRALRAEGAKDSDMRDWLCLVAHESSYRYDVTHKNDGGSTDYGIFQMDDKYTCGNADGTSTSICWRIRTFGCEDACSTFIDSDIRNDANCAVRVRNCDGFRRWYGWVNNCSSDELEKPDYDFEDC